MVVDVEGVTEAGFESFVCVAVSVVRRSEANSGPGPQPTSTQT